jgi:hypothetical protein
MKDISKNITPLRVIVSACIFACTCIAVDASSLTGNKFIDLLISLPVSIFGFSLSFDVLFDVSICRLMKREDISKKIDSNDPYKPVSDSTSKIRNAIRHRRIIPFGNVRRHKAS